MAFLRLAFVLSLLLTSCVSDEVRLRREGARSAAEAESAGPEVPEAYRIGPGDSLRIEHPFNEELNRVVVVRPDGFVTLPLVEEIGLANRTLPEAQGVIAERYATTVRNSKVTVGLETAANFKICVGGEVLHPGMFALADGVTALRAIAMAGGPRPTATMGSVVVLRDRGAQEPQYLLLDLGRMTAKLEGRGDLRLRAKDMVFVPRSTIATMDAFVDQYINQLIPFSKNLGVTYLIGNGGLLMTGNSSSSS